MAEAVVTATPSAEPVVETPVITDNKIIINGEEYDPQRALKTIKDQRESEAQLKADLAKYRKAEADEAEAQKTLEQKLQARDLEVLELRKTLAVRKAADEFKAQADEAGITDPELALLAAERDGLFGAFDPESGSIEVGKVDFDKLVAAHPALAGKVPERKPAADAGRLGGGAEPKSKARLFNDAVRFAD